MHKQSKSKSHWYQGVILKNIIIKLSRFQKKNDVSITNFIILFNFKKLFQLVQLTTKIKKDIIQTYSNTAAKDTLDPATSISNTKTGG